MKYRIYLWLTLMAVCVAVANAQGAPDVGGTWEMNPDRGENLGMVAAVKQTLVVTQTDASVTLDYTNVFRGEASTRQVSLDLAGVAVENAGPMGDPSTTASAWVDDRLVTTWTTAGAIPGTEVVRIETLALSADGAELSISTERANKPTMVLVYERQ